MEYVILAGVDFENECVRHGIASKMVKLGFAVKWNSRIGFIQCLAPYRVVSGNGWMCYQIAEDGDGIPNGFYPPDE